MKIRLSLSLLAFALPMALPAAEESATPPPKSSWYNRLLHPFGGSKETAPKTPGANFKHLELALKIEPNPPKLSATKQVKVTLTLANKTSKLVQLEFPTSQRIEVLIKAKDGKMVEQWSEDQAFDNEPTIVAINPGERLEYGANVSLRDLHPEETYTVEAFFPNFDALRKTVTIKPEK